VEVGTRSGPKSVLKRISDIWEKKDRTEWDTGQSVSLGGGEAWVGKSLPAVLEEVRHHTFQSDIGEEGRSLEGSSTGRIKVCGQVHNRAATSSGHCTTKKCLFLPKGRGHRTQKRRGNEEFSQSEGKKEKSNGSEKDACARIPRQNKGRSNDSTSRLPRGEQQLSQCDLPQSGPLQERRATRQGRGTEELPLNFNPKTQRGLQLDATRVTGYSFQETQTESGDIPRASVQKRT